MLLVHLAQTRIRFRLASAVQLCRAPNAQTSILNTSPAPEDIPWRHSPCYIRWSSGRNFISSPRVQLSCCVALALLLGSTELQPSGSLLSDYGAAEHPHNHNDLIFAVASIMAINCTLRFNGQISRWTLCFCFTIFWCLTGNSLPWQWQSLRNAFL